MSSTLIPIRCLFIDIINIAFNELPFLEKTVVLNFGSKE